MPILSKVLLFLALLFMTLSSRALAKEGDYFPYVYTPEADLPAYARFRAEGMPINQAFWHGLKYLAKYRRKKFSAPVEEIRYFDFQRSLLGFLSNEQSIRVHGPSVNLAMVGDIMWIQNDWSTFVTKEVLDTLNKFDVVLGNLETVISSNFKVREFWPDYMRYNSHPSLVQSFKRYSGGNLFTALSIANNHTMDYSDRGILDTMEFLDGNGILYSGVGKGHDAKPYTTFVKNGVKFGFYAVTYGLNDQEEARRTKLRLNILPGLAPETEKPVDISQVQRVLAAMAADGVDFKIVSLHWGSEFEFYPSPKTMQVGREIIAAGADVIMGSHPHVQQPSEICFVNGYEERFGDLKGRFPAMIHPTGCVLKDGRGGRRKALILYSLGNFTTAMYTFLCQAGIIQHVKVTRDAISGEVDWSLPGYKLVYNLKSDPVTGKRMILLMDSYISQNCRQKKCPEEVAKSMSFLHRHLIRKGA